MYETFLFFTQIGVNCNILGTTVLKTLQYSGVVLNPLFCNRFNRKVLKITLLMKLKISQLQPQ